MFRAIIPYMAEEQKFDARLAEGVAYFEQMLQIMPEDRVTLEFLVVAYDQLGQEEKGRQALVSLAKILLKEQDKAALEGLLPRLEACELPEAKVLALKAKMAVAPAPELVPEAPKELTDAEKAAVVSKAAVEAELALAEALREGGVVSESEFAHVREFVGSSPVDGRVFLVSALQILEKENPALTERCAAYLADKYGTPPIPLAAFDPPKDLLAKFPAAFLRIRGVMPFAKLGSLTLVAVLNPVDEGLRAELNAVMPCRLYLADPSAMEAALEKAFGTKKVN